MNKEEKEANGDNTQEEINGGTVGDVATRKAKKVFGTIFLKSRGGNATQLTYDSVSHMVPRIQTRTNGLHRLWRRGPLYPSLQ